MCAPSSSVTQTSPSQPVGYSGDSLTLSTWTTGNTLDDVPGYTFRYVGPADYTSSASCHHASTAYGAAVTAVNGNISNAIFPLSRTITDVGDVSGTGEVCWTTGVEDSDQYARGKVVTVN